MPSPTAPTAKHCAVEVAPKLRMTTAQTEKGQTETSEDNVSDREGCDAVQVEWGTHHVVDCNWRNLVCVPSPLQEQETP